MSSYIIKVQENGKIATRMLISRTGRNFEPVVVSAKANTVYTLTDAAEKPLKKILVKRKSKNLLVFLDGKESDTPDLVLENYADVEKSTVLSTKTAQGIAEFAPTAPASDFFNYATNSETSESAPQWLAAEDGTSAFSALYDSPYFPLAVVGGVAAVAALVKKGSSTSTTSTSLSTLTSYATDTAGKVAAPSASDYTNAGLSGVDSNNLNLVNSSVQRMKADSASKISTIIAAAKKIIAKANGNEADTNTNDPTRSDYQALGISLLNAESNDTQLGLLTDIIKARISSEVGTVAKLDALAAIADKLMVNAKGNIPATQLTNSDLNSIGLTDITASNVGAFLSAVTASSDDGKQISTLSQLKDISAAYLKILALADGTRGNADATRTPTATDYATIGAKIGLAATDATALKLLNDTIDGLSSTPVSKVERLTAADAGVNINDIAAAIGKIYQVRSAADATAATAVGLTSTDLGSLGFSSTVTSYNLPSIISALRLDAASTLDTFAKLKTAVNIGAAMYYAESSPSDTTKHIAPNSLDFYKDIGLATTDSGTTKAVTAANYQALNSAIEAQTNADSVNSKDKIQTLLNTYGKVFAMADGTRDNLAKNNTPVATIDDYLALGALKNYDATSGAIDGSITSKAATTGNAQKDAALALINNAVDGLSTTSVDTIAEINKIAIATDKVMDLAAGNNPTAALTTNDLGLLGLSGITSTNLDKIIANIKATASANGQAVDTVGELQSLVSLSIAQLYADSSTNPTPSLQNYKDLDPSSTDVNWDSNLVTAVNSVIEPLTGTGVTTSGIKDIAKAYQSILSEAKDTSNANTDPTAAQYATVLGTTSHQLNTPTGSTVASNALSLLNDIIRQRDTSYADTKSELEALASKVDNIMKVATGTGSTTFAELGAMGFDTHSWSDYSQTSKIVKINDLIKATDDSGSGVHTFAEIKAIIDSTAVFQA